MAYEALVLLMLLALLLYITRLWPILLLVILGIFIATLRLLFLSCKTVEPTEPILALPEATEPLVPKEHDVQTMGYWVIQNRITQILYRQFPKSRWVWENPRARQDIELNQAGGYRRGEVLIRNLQVMDIVFDEIAEPSQPVGTQQTENKKAQLERKKEPDPPDEEEEIQEDFGLLLLSG